MINPSGARSVKQHGEEYWRRAAKPYSKPYKKTPKNDFLLPIFKNEGTVEIIGRLTSRRVRSPIEIITRLTIRSRNGTQFERKSPMKEVRIPITEKTMRKPNVHKSPLVTAFPNDVLAPM